MVHHISYDQTLSVLTIFFPNAVHTCGSLSTEHNLPIIISPVTSTL